MGSTNLHNTSNLPDFADVLPIIPDLNSGIKERIRSTARKIAIENYEMPLRDTLSNEIIDLVELALETGIGFA